MNDGVETTSYWTDSASIPRYPALDRTLDVDVVVVGAGITGLTAAYLLKKAGRRVAVLERRRVGGVDTMMTTAHVTCVTDLDLSALVKTFGRDHAQATWDAGLAAIAQIDTIVSDEDIDCGWTWVEGVKHVPAGQDGAKDAARLQEEARLASELGFEARYVDKSPFMNQPGAVFGGQARIHPRKYLAALAAAVDGGGSFVFEESGVDEVADEPLGVKARGHHVGCQYIVLATHTPLMGKTNMASATLLQTKLYLYTSYVVGGRIAKGTVPDLLFWDTADPYHYLRIDEQPDHDLVIFGGEDHKTGQAEDTEACFAKLESAAKALIPGLELTHRWSGQVIETNDGLPFIGETSSRQFTGTGYAGNGTTFGTLAGMMAADAALGVKNPWAELFDVGRTKIRGGAWDYIKENVDYPYYMVRDRLVGPDATSLRELARGEGKIIEVQGERVAAYRAENGRITTLSPICTHMGCQVDWNTAERTWDCPCHGSRFTATGDVLAGPAETPLERKVPAK
jgi:glycine/D-amino acid oxidase-like deaminating enzyme/nitrite reductase/ring-hydroxylating ferredoxin subunit